MLWLLVRRIDLTTVVEKAIKTKLMTGDEVSTKFYQKLQNQILKLSNSIAVGAVCTAEDMCGRQFWINELFIQDHNLAGRCIKDMANRALIPYEFVGRRTDNKSTYRRI